MRTPTITVANHKDDILQIAPSKGAPSAEEVADLAREIPARGCQGNRHHTTFGEQHSMYSKATIKKSTMAKRRNGPI